MLSIPNPKQKNKDLIRYILKQMFAQSLYFYLLLFAFLLPIIIAGIIILRKTSSIERFELLLPVGSILGILLFTFILNITSFYIKGLPGAIFSYLVLISLSILIYLKRGLSKVLYPNGKLLLLYIASLGFWGILLIWKGNYALIGSDTNLYYAVAHTFIKGNFPPMTPWQPDLPLFYHLGASELLGAFYLFTGLSFQFLHLIFSTLFILCSVQIFIWIWGRHKDLLSFLLANLAGLVVFVSFGFLYLLLPNFSIHLPNIHNLNEFIIFLRNLPSVNQSIEVYGAPINLDALIYFIFHAYGLSIFLSIVSILIYYKKNNSLITWAILSVGLSTLALVSESIFVATAPAVFVGVLLIEEAKGTIFKNLRSLILLGVVTIIVMLFQGGIITSVISPSKIKDESIVVFPSKEDIKEDFTSYHYHQGISKTLPINDEWLSLYWFHVGVDLLILMNILILIKLKSEYKHFILLLTLFITGFTSLFAYNVLVPKFLVANGNRFLSFSFLTFSLVVCFFLIHLISSPNRGNLLKKIFLTAFVLWLFIPTILPPLALLSKTRFGENKLIPRKEQTTIGVEWIKNNLSYNSRVAVLDVRAPHPSGMARVMVQAGVFAPVFPPEFRAYTIEASPEYIDIAYYLSPKVIKKFKVDTLLIDSHYYENADKFIKMRLNDKKYFKVLFEKTNPDKSWERVLKVQSEYYNLPESEGTLDQLSKITLIGKIYIDNEENFNPSFLRRPLIFTLRNRDLYFLPQSGVYLNVEADINWHEPKENKKYDYLVLSKTTDPFDICQCEAELIWKGVLDKVYLWKRQDRN